MSLTGEIRDRITWGETNTQIKRDLGDSPTVRGILSRVRHESARSGRRRAVSWIPPLTLRLKLQKLASARGEQGLALMRRVLALLEPGLVAVLLDEAGGGRS